MSEPDFPYDKKPRPEQTSASSGPVTIPPPPDYPPSPPGPPTPPPFSSDKSGSFTCQTCGKTFKTREELTMHIEVEHQSPKKKV